MAHKDVEAEVAEFIRTRGVTRCPTACVGATQASVAAADRSEIRRHADALELARLAKSPRYRKAQPAQAA